MSAGERRISTEKGGLYQGRVDGIERGITTRDLELNLGNVDNWDERPHNYHNTVLC